MHTHSWLTHWVVEVVEKEEETAYYQQHDHNGYNHREDRQLIRRRLQLLIKISFIALATQQTIPTIIVTKY
jgi:hypothetical protein